MEHYSPTFCVESIIRFFASCVGRGSNPRRSDAGGARGEGVRTFSSDSIQPGLQTGFSDVEKPGVFGDMPHGAYEIRIPSMSGSPGVKAWVPKTKRRSSLTDFLPTITPPKVKESVRLQLPPRKKIYSRKERSWNFPSIDPEEVVEMRLNDEPKINREKWVALRKEYNCGKGQDRRDISLKFSRQTYKKVPNLLGYEAAKERKDMKVHRRVWMLKHGIKAPEKLELRYLSSS